jgi:hypothetical protein
MLLNLMVYYTLLAIRLYGESRYERYYNGIELQLGVFRSAAVLRGIQ